MNHLPTYIDRDYKKSHFFKNTSRLVCGCSGLGGVWRPVTEKVAVGTLLYAMENGISVFDVAPSYNRGQEFLGKALRESSRKDFFISTKVGRLKANRADHVKVDYNTDAMRKSIYESLDMMHLEHIDLLFLHEPHLAPLDKMNEIMDCLSQFKEEGVVRRLGIGGNPPEEFYPYVRNEYFEVVSGFLKMDACNLSAFSREVPHLKKEKMAYYAASGLHMGLLGRRLDQYARQRPDSEWISNEDVDIALKINELAEMHEMPLSRLAMRYLFSMEEADRVVIGPSNLAQLKDMMQAWDEGKLRKNLFDEITNIIISNYY